MATTTFSRLGSANTYDNARANLMTRQTSLVSLQEKMTAGKRVNTPSDDPTAAAQAERALNRIERIKTDQRALDSQRNAIAQAESVLGDVTDTLQSIRELMVSAGDGGYTSAERRTIAMQIQGMRDQVFALSNRKDTNGLPLFGSLASALKPFVGPQTIAPDYTFQGLPGQNGSTEVTIASTLDGDSAFMHQPNRDGVYNIKVTNTTAGLIPSSRTLQTDNVTVTSPGLVTGSAYAIDFTAIDTTTVPGTTTATYTLTDTTNAPGVPFATQTISYPTDQPANILIADDPPPPAAPTTLGLPGLSFTITGTPDVGDSITIDPSPSIFSVLDNAIRDIGDAPNGNAAAQAVGQALTNIDIGMSRVAAVRSQAGDLLNRADRISVNQEKRSIQMETDRSRAEDMDMMTGISDFQNQQTGYQAALQSYAQIQKLSLFNFIG